MSKCVSEQILKRICVGLLASLFFSAAMFYSAQNYFHVIGGVIAIPKLLWLSLVLLAWYAIPLLVSLDVRVVRNIRYIYKIFLWNMLARAVIELWMLYITHSWHPFYGIGHDLFSLLLLMVLMHRLPPCSRALDKLCLLNLWVISLMFIIEISFAWYMARYFITTGPHAIYFVPDDPEHARMIQYTWWVVGSLAVYFFEFSRRWLYAPLKD